MHILNNNEFTRILSQIEIDEIFVSLAEGVPLDIYITYEKTAFITADDAEIRDTAIRAERGFITNLLFDDDEIFFYPAGEIFFCPADSEVDPKKTMN